MNRWWAVVLLVMFILVAAMGLRNLVVNQKVAANNGPLVAVTSGPVPPSPWMVTSGPVPPSPWKR